MNYKERYLLQSKVMNSLHSGFKLNALLTSSVESIAHFMAKAKKFKELRDAGNNVVSECQFKSGGRADLLCINSAEIFEILKSEKLSDAKKKEKKYPEFFKIYYIKV